MSLPCSYPHSHYHVPCRPVPSAHQIRAEATERVVDVKVCCSMREAFSLLDFDDPSIVDLKRLLLQVWKD